MQRRGLRQHQRRRRRRSDRTHERRAAGTDRRPLSFIDSRWWRRSREDVAAAFENLGRVGIADKAFARADALSGGQQQRVGIARALMQHPELMLADEPVASLDPATSHSVMKYLEEINKKDGITVICSLHFLSLARRYGTRVIALKGGKVAFDGRPADIDERRFKEIYGEDAVEVEIGPSIAQPMSATEAALVALAD